MSSTELDTERRLRVATEAIIERLRARARIKEAIATRSDDPIISAQQAAIAMGLNYAADVVSELLEEFE